MEKNKFCLDEKSIGNLIEAKYKFEIPEYQRGYRWEKENVKELLDDIEISRKKNNEKYHLQPIIVKENGESKYYLIDGQQRLTTIYMVLKYIKHKLEMDAVNTFEIKYNYITNENDELLDISEKIINYLDKNEMEYENLNDYYYEQALEIIKEWFENYTETKELVMYICKNVFVMWYELDKEEDEKKVFLRVNSGKIKLTAADLIKAEFLKNDTKNKNLVDKIGKEWEELEKKLYDNSFWYFISNKITNDRMSEFFKILYKDIEDIEVYNYYKEKINEDIKKAWENDIKGMFQYFVEWYENDEFYNYIGFMVKVKNNKQFFEGMLKLTQKDDKVKDKNKLIQYIKKEIRDNILKDLNVNSSEDEEVEKEEFKRKIEGLYYNNKEDDKIKNILLLYNILTINEAICSKRFPFDKYFVNKEEREEKRKEGMEEKEITWSLEHISSQHETTNIEKETEYKEFVKYFNIINKNQSKSLPTVEEWKMNRETVNKQVKNELDEIKKSEDYSFEIHGIGNLALLEKKLNSSNGNSFFVKKRNNIIKKSKVDYIPNGTIKVFLKAFGTEELENKQFFEWDKNDYETYKQDIIDTIYDKIIKIGGEKSNES